METAVSVNVTENPALVAAIVTGPAVAPNVTLTPAAPLASVFVAVADSIACPDVTANVTGTPATAMPRLERHLDRQRLCQLRALRPRLRIPAL